MSTIRMSAEDAMLRWPISTQRRLEIIDCLLGWDIVRNMRAAKLFVAEHFVVVDADGKRDLATGGRVSERPPSEQSIPRDLARNDFKLFAEGWAPPKCRHGSILLGCPHDDCVEQSSSRSRKRRCASSIDYRQRG